jgi:hypothetical protein
LITIALFIIGGSVIAYLLTNFSVGQSLLYVILRKKKDDENLIERKDEDELEEEDESEEIPDESESDKTNNEDKDSKANG